MARLLPPRSAALTTPKPRHLPAPYARLGMLAVVLPGCAPDDCPKGSVRNVADGLCYMVDEGEDGDGTTAAVDDTDDDPPDTGTAPGDSGDPPDEPLVVTDSCEPPGALPADPITDLGAFNLQDEAFVEGVDIEVDTATGMAVIAGQGGLMLMDINNPSDPTWIGHDGPIEFRQRYQNLELAPDGLVFVTHWDFGFVVYDSRTGGVPRMEYTFEAEGLAGMALHDNILYVVDKKNATVAVWDVADPTRPLVLTEVAGLAAPFVPFLNGDYLYVADNTLGIVVYDVSTPEFPRLAGSVSGDASIQDLAFSADGSTLYAAAGGAGIQVYSLDDPTTPQLVETISLPYSVISVDTGDGLLWAVDQQDVIAVDIADPRVPVVLNAHRTGQWSMHVAAVGNQAWVADWAWLRGYAAEGEPVGDLNLSSTQVYVAPEGEDATVQLLNPSGEPLVVSGVEVSDPRVTWSLEDGRIPAGGSQPLTLSYAGEGPLDATVCIASDDPDAPQQQLQVVASSDSDSTGIGVAAPDFELDDLEGNTWRLSDLRGRPVVLAYFATW